MHKEGEIRVYTALLLGQLFARFNAGYRKRRPEGMKDIAQEKVLNLWKHYLQIIIRPDYRLVDIQQRRIRSQLKNIMLSLQKYMEPSDYPMFMGALMEWYRNPREKEIQEQFVMMNCVEVFQLERMEKEDVDAVCRFALFCAESPNEEVKTAAWRAIRQITSYVLKSGMKHEELEAWNEIASTISSIPTDDSTLYTFLKYRIFTNLGLDTAAQQKLLYDRDVLTDIFLDNLKTGTPWVQQAVNIRLLADQVLHGGCSHVMQIATHFSNMIKVGQYMLARDGAGKALLQIMPFLRVDQRNEIAVEMLRGLDTGESDYSRTIPRWLGRVALWLPPEQRPGDRGGTGHGGHPPGTLSGVQRTFRRGGEDRKRPLEDASRDPDERHGELPGGSAPGGPSGAGAVRVRLRDPDQGRKAGYLLRRVPENVLPAE